MKPADGQPGSSPRIEQEIVDLRQEIGDLVGELDRRRREAFDVRLQLRRHPFVVAAAGATVALVVTSAVTVLVRGARERRRPSYKARQLRRAFERMIDRPERVARSAPPPAERILVAIGTAAASLLVKQVFASASSSGPTAAKRQARSTESSLR